MPSKASWTPRMSVWYNVCWWWCRAIPLTGGWLSLVALTSCHPLSCYLHDLDTTNLNPRKTGGGGIRPPWQKIYFFNMKTGFNDPETPWLPQFYTNESNGTKFSACFYIGMGLRDFFARNSLGENGYFIGFWDFRPHFKLILHSSKWILCPQKVWKLFIYVLGSIQHNL